MSTTPFLAEFMTAPPTLSDGQSSPIRCDAYGTLVGAVPGQVAALDMDFVGNNGWLAGTPTAITSIISCTRASTGSYMTKAGILQPAIFANNVLRMGDNGLLIEEQRVNSCLQSNAFTTTWAPNTHATLTPNSTTSPDGTNNAWNFSINSTSSNDLAQNITLTANTVYTLTVYVKLNVSGGPTMETMLGVWDNTSSSMVGQVNATWTGSVPVPTLFSGTSTNVVALPNNWYRYSLTFSTAVGHTSHIIYLKTDNSGLYSSGSVYWYGAQLEAGAFPTSYIPTTTASVTRNADVVPFLTTSWLDTTKGTFYAQATVLAAMSGNYRLFGLSGATGESPLIHSTDTQITSYANGTLNSVSTGSGTWSTGAKAAMGYDSTGNSVCMNNGTVGSNANAPTSFANMYLGYDPSNPGVNMANAYIKRASYWSSRLSNSTLQALTTP